MDIKAEVVGDTLKLVALNADADTWMGSNGFTPAGPACYTHEASELVQITICAGWEGLVVTKVDGPVFATKVQCPECDGGEAFSDCTLCQGTGKCSQLQADESTARDQELNGPDDGEEWGFCGCGVELSNMTSSDGEQCDDCNDQATQ